MEALGNCLAVLSAKVSPAIPEPITKKSVCMILSEL
jgi:hypothetical protein